ncbi:MAG: division/cell wall cluster transcriptional repressor MraZ [Clostridia bacterium]|nr:division/cell wall cluster transcriptional repressor MraZ [Clostridia bacterium]MBQ6836766.1 division/cell wall cluster transcriptional repressor MraZ [Clostridia bacterium]MBQ6868150.1 division/cell wall cluster transcriptional repressor MraZ [Clostridia bacterium]MBQ6934761.1 division/cell wall cluster transcriptional repressor MraZ [Clostridia bacterium]MBQ7087966.1 division/cell wall cluster transcriptional repressor MraZ [Clostridia bacterium]
MKGTYEHNVDAKGRLFIPTKLRDELGDNFVMTKGLDGCLSLYSQKNWAIMEEKIASLPSSKARSLQRYFFSNAMDCEPDSQGRVVIPQVLREFAGITKAVVVIGIVDKAEIWDAEKWRQYNESIDEEDVLKSMEELGI